ncbi:nuclear transport factor 2 family protein [Myxococcus sp. Y35]|uniref:nuclear transport factor 2 family protein n=1 Tax=Pseudomyxococcus flavus TaxID=3115648 RepID=UPI003CEF67DC
MAPGTDSQRIEAIRSYFRKVDEKDSTLSDLFTDDVQFYFPKFGPARGKAALVRFSERFGREVASLVHDIDGLVFTVDGDRIAVEGQERGVTREGVRWPDGEISQGRFCNVFEFSGPFISRVHIYVDPDFTNADRRRVRLYREHAPAPTPREVAERYLQAVQAFHANPTASATLAEVVALFDEDVDWSIDGDVARVPWIGPRRGHAAVGDFFRELISYVEPRRFEARTILADDETAVILGELASLVKATGRLIETAFAFDLTVRAGKITRYRMFEDSHAVARAV